MFCFKEIYSAYLRCRRRKRNTYNALYFEQNLIENICNLETSLNDRAHPKLREVSFLSVKIDFTVYELFCKVGFSRHI
jgi:hypothetical protein